MNVKLFIALFITCLDTVKSDSKQEKADFPTKNPSLTHGRSTSVIYLPEYGSVRYVRPTNFKNSTRILFWSKAYGRRNHWTDWWFNKKSVKDTCPELNCHFSIDRKDLNVSDAVVVMTYGGSFNWTAEVARQLPPTRLPHQRWVFLMLEPPNLRGVNHSELNGLFNWTATYKLDSDVVIHFGRVSLQRLPSHLVGKSMKQDFTKGKSKLVGWLVSHCSTEGRRMNYVKELKKFIPVDIYGRCGNRSCPRGKNCYQALGQQYKFYLSFENILCKDYVTEKFFQALANGMVPVTFGGSDYTRFAPRGSFINALDFSSPRLLAEHLMFLHNNDAEYNKYFDWRRSYGKPVVYRVEHWVCEMCLKLMDPSQPVKVYNDLDRWWNAESNCSYWDQHKGVVHK